jgi:hypothetical protein
MPAHFLAAFAAAIVLLLLLAVGLWEMIRGVAVFWHLAERPAMYASEDAAALQMAARGLEFLFLAPLGFLLVFGVTHYVAARVAPPDDSLEEHRDSRLQRLEEARLDLLVVKAFTVSLFAAVVAAGLVGRALTPAGLSYSDAISGSLVLVVLASYFVVLEKLIGEARRHIRQ